jgi:hypothetical protein
MLWRGLRSMKRLLLSQHDLVITTDGHGTRHC